MLDADGGCDLKTLWRLRQQQQRTYIHVLMHMVNRCTIINELSIVLISDVHNQMCVCVCVCDINTNFQQHRTRTRSY